jgi:hypothetical protein
VWYLCALAHAAELVEVGGGVWLAEHAGQGARADATGKAAGLRVRVRPAARWAVEGLVGWSPAGPEGALEGVSFLGDPARDIVPILTLGAGADARGGAFVSAGPGLDLVLGPRADVRLDARARLDASGSAALVFATGLAFHGGRRVDLDGDHLAGASDSCPDVPEDRDDFQDEDGCPDPDDDLDGLPDARDACPRSPEDRDGFLDLDGCPEPDNDGDGLVDDKDACIFQPEDPDDYRDGDGCPDPDDDEDSVSDDADRCPRVPEDRDGFEDSDGCPDSDNDSDGVPDAQDVAPDAAETRNGWEDSDGRPDAVPRVLARLIGPQPRLRLEGADLSARAQDVLESLADALGDYPQARVLLRVPEAAVAEVLRAALARMGLDPNRVRVQLRTPEGLAGDVPAAGSLVEATLLDAADAWPLPPDAPASELPNSPSR